MVTGTSNAVPRWTMAQKAFGTLIAFAIFLDGFDNQLIALCLPAISTDWGIDRGSFATVVAIGLVGIAIGNAFAGYANDTIGRRLTLISSMTVMALSNLSTAMTTDLVSFGIARLFVGIGLGSTLSSAVVTLNEFTPKHRRSTMVAFGMLCMPLGGLVASSMSAALLENMGWQTMFIFGGAAPLAIAALIFLVLPESPPFLATQPHRAEELAKLLKRLGVDDPSDLSTAAPKEKIGKVSALFTPEYRRDTLLIWFSFLSCFVALYLILSWLPSLFAGIGASLAFSSTALAAQATGSLIGSIILVVIAQRFGTKLPMILFGLLGAVLIAIFSFVFGTGASNIVVLGLIALFSVAMAIMINLLYVLVPQMYPATHRGTGVGIALASGRIGGVASAFIGGGLLTYGGQLFFLVDAAALFIVVLSVWGITRHVPPTKK